MDDYGIGSAMKGVAEVYFRSARGAGRTTAMLDRMKDGDRVCFSTSHLAKDFKRQADQRGLKIECIVCPPKESAGLYSRGTPSGRMVFDHVWIEDFYRAAIERAAAEIDHWTVQLSGDGPAHAATRLQAQEIAKWR